MNTILDTQLHTDQPNTAIEVVKQWLRLAYFLAARLDRAGIALARLGLVVVLCWIGGTKFAAYEAESIVPFVANSLLMSFFYSHPAPEYQHYANKEGELVPAHRQWHETNRTYLFSYGLGSVIILIGLLIALHPVLPQIAALGSLLLIGMSLTTLSFLVTTPEAWVPALGTSAHGFRSWLGQVGWSSKTPSCSARPLLPWPTRQRRICNAESAAVSTIRAREIRGASPLVVIENEAPAGLIVDPPLPGPLAAGRVFVQYRAESCRIVPVFGEGALNVLPRIGHVHVTVDDSPRQFVDASGETIILVGLVPGPHKVRIDLANPTHQVITTTTISFNVLSPKIQQPPSSSQ